MGNLLRGERARLRDCEGLLLRSLLGLCVDLFRYQAYAFGIFQEGYAQSFALTKLRANPVQNFFMLRAQDNPYTAVSWQRMTSLCTIHLICRRIRSYIIPVCRLKRRQGRFCAQKKLNDSGTERQKTLQSKHHRKRPRILNPLSGLQQAFPGRRIASQAMIFCSEITLMPFHYH